MKQGQCSNEAAWFYLLYQSYLDPRNPRHAHLEAESLIQISDTNKDQQLSMKEILASADIFLASKVIDTETNFHDEF